MWFDASYVTANIKNVVSESCKTSKTQALCATESSVWFGARGKFCSERASKHLSLRNFQYKWSRKWEKHNQRPTSVQLGHDTSLRNTRFNVKKDVCMLKNRKGPSPSRAPQSVVQSEPSQNPCNIYSIYKKKLNNEPQHEQSEFLCESENVDLTNDSRRKFINEAHWFSYKNQFWGKNIKPIQLTTL